MAHYLCNDKKQICLIFKDYEMEFYEVLEKRRTYRDFSGREVSDEALKRIISAAFKAPANDHLRQFEAIRVCRGAWTGEYSQGHCSVGKEHGSIQEAGCRGGRIGR